MTKDSVQPVTVLLANWTISLLLILAVVGPPRVVAPFGDTAVFARVDETIGAVIELRLPVHALPVSVAVSGVPDHS